jgi:hypothetical protein
MSRPENATTKLMLVRTVLEAGTACSNRGRPHRGTHERIVCRGPRSLG